MGLATAVPVISHVLVPGHVRHLQYMLKRCQMTLIVTLCQKKLKCDCEMCLDSLGVTNHSRGHHPSTDSVVRGVLSKDWHLHKKIVV